VSSGGSCSTCGLTYAYDLAVCTSCGSMLEPLRVSRRVALAVTEVATPSIGHGDVPYWCVLAEAEDGHRCVAKSSRAVSVGDTLTEDAAAPAGCIQAVGIVGSGVMARGLVELMLSRGHRVVWVGRSLERLDASREKVVERLAKAMDENQTGEALGRLVMSGSTTALAECDIVIEAIVEELEPKQDIIRRIEEVVGEECIIATNTSSLPLDAMSLGMRRPQRFGGLHFFNPPMRMRLVEVVRGPQTDDAVESMLVQFAESLGKTSIPVAAGPGFVVNCVLMPLLNEAVRALEDGIAPAEAIDEAVMLGLNHPMGPLALADLIGLDVVTNIMDDLYGRLGDEAYAPRPLLKQLVQEGKLGRKTGEGLFTHTRPPVSG